MMTSDNELRLKMAEVQVKLVELRKLCEDKLNACYENPKVSDIEIASAAMDFAQVNAAIDVLK